MFLYLGNLCKKQQTRFPNQFSHHICHLATAPLWSAKERQNSFIQTLRCSFFSSSISLLLSIRSFLIIKYACSQSSWNFLNRAVCFDFLTQQEEASGSTMQEKSQATVFLNIKKGCDFSSLHFIPKLAILAPVIIFTDTTILMLM